MSQEIWFAVGAVPLVVTQDGGRSVCQIYGRTGEEIDNRRRLIAEAPTMLSLLERIHADADSQYEGGSNNGQAKISSDLYQELCEFVASFKS